MAKRSNQKLKLLYLAKIFHEETDEEHALTLQEITARLAAYGVSADRKTLYSDFEELKVFGLDIIDDRRGHNTYYYLGARDFQLPELKLLVDSVQAAKFITDRKSRELIGKLERLINVQQAQLLNRQVFIAGRTKTMNERIYYSIDKLHAAINGNTQIRFKYFQWNMYKQQELRHNGAWYQVSPWALLWDDEKYYLIAYDASDGLVKHYRVEKMLHIEPTGEPRLGGEHFKKFDVARYSKNLFGMYGGKECDVLLEGSGEMANVLIDRFGRDLPIIPKGDDTFEARVTVALSPQFYGWIMGLDGKIRITGPAAVVAEMRAALYRQAQLYGPGDDAAETQGE